MQHMLNLYKESVGGLRKHLVAEVTPAPTADTPTTSKASEDMDLRRGSQHEDRGGVRQQERGGQAATRQLLGGEDPFWMVGIGKRHVHLSQCETGGGGTRPPPPRATSHADRVHEETFTRGDGGVRGSVQSGGRRGGAAWEGRAGDGGAGDGHSSQLGRGRERTAAGGQGLWGAGRHLLQQTEEAPLGSVGTPGIEGAAAEQVSQPGRALQAVTGGGQSQSELVDGQRLVSYSDGDDEEWQQAGEQGTGDEGEADTWYENLQGLTEAQAGDRTGRQGAATSSRQTVTAGVMGGLSSFEQAAMSGFMDDGDTPQAHQGLAEPVALKLEIQHFTCFVPGLLVLGECSHLLLSRELNT